MIFFGAFCSLSGSETETTLTKIYISMQPVDGVFRLGREYKKRLVKVMRLSPGDALHVITPGKKWECVVQHIGPDEIELKVTKEIPVDHSGSLQLILCQAIPKGDRFEWLIQKATELGVSEIYPLITERTVVKPANVSGKLQRWNEIAGQAAGQSENTQPAIIHEPVSLPSLLQNPINSQLKFVLHERKQGVSLREAISTKRNDIHRIIYIVGPEGGWSESETDTMVAAGYQLVHLGPRILRAETCGLVVTALLQYELGDMLA